MMQIAIWGIAAMLVVKMFDILHQQSVAKAAGHPGSDLLSTLGAVVALVSAIALIVLADQQVKSTPTMPTLPSFGN